MRAVNLLPSETKQPRKRPTAAMQVALVVPFVVAGLIAAGYLLTSSDVNSKRSTLQALQDELASLPAPSPQQQQNPALAAERASRITALGAALQNRLVWDRILRQISAVLPGDVWLTQMSGQAPQVAPAAPAPTTTSTTTTTTTTTTPAAPVPAPAPTPGPLTLTGYTYSQEGVARLLSRLAVVPALQDVKLVQSSESLVGQQTVISFSIQAAVRPGETG